MEDYRREAEERRMQRGLQNQEPDLEAGAGATKGSAYPEAPKMEVPRTQAAEPTTSALPNPSTNASSEPVVAELPTRQ